MITAPTKQKAQFHPETLPPVKFTINLDWFEVLLAGALVEFNFPLGKYDYDQGKITLVQKKMGTKQFKYGYDIFVKGKIFGEIFCCPRNVAILQPETIQFKAVNNVLYEKGFIRECRYVFGKLGWKVRNVSRIDIALDGAGFMKVFKDWRKGKIEKLGKAKVNTFETSKRVVTGFDVGSKSSNKWLTCYYKGKELERSNKHYIGDMWKRANLKVPVMHVERLEIKLRNEALKEIKYFDWRELESFEYLASLMKTAITNFFDFVKKGDDTNISRAKRLQFIDWDSIGGTDLERLSTEQTSEVYSYKLTAKRMFGIYIQTGIAHYADVAQEIAININCLEWYIAHLDAWRVFFEQKLGNNKDGEIVYPYLARYKTYEANEQLKLYPKNDDQVTFFTSKHY